MTAPITDPATHPIASESTASIPARSVSRGFAARVAGASYLAMFALAIFANFVVREGLVVAGDAAATVANLTGSLGLFRLGVGAFLVIVLLDVVIAWALHVVFRSVDADRSLAAAWFRLVYSAFLGVAVAFLFGALGQVAGAAAADPATVMAAVDTFEQIWLIGLAAFGVHLALLGDLVRRSGIASKWLGGVVIAAGAVYVLDTFARILLPNHGDIEGMLLAVVAVTSMLGEGWLGLWLLTTRRLGRDRTPIGS